MSELADEGAERAALDPLLSTDRVEAPALAGLRERLDDLRRRLDAPPEEVQRAPLRDDLLDLVREIDATTESLRVLREEMKPLAERYKQLYLRRAPEAGHLVDHLGASTFRERGWSALAGGAYDEAVSHLRGAIERDPGETSAMAMLAWAYLHLGKATDAERVLDHALAKEPHHPLARTIMGLVRLRGGHVEPAVALLRTVAQDDSIPDRTARMYAHLYLGVALARGGQPADGRESIRRAIALGPNLTEAFWELGRIHASEGERELALEAWRAGAENRFSGWGERCRAEVEALEAGAAENDGRAGEAGEAGFSEPASNESGVFGEPEESVQSEESGASEDSGASGESVESVESVEWGASGELVESGESVGSGGSGGSGASEESGASGELVEYGEAAEAAEADGTRGEVAAEQDGSRSDTEPGSS